MRRIDLPQGVHVFTAVDSFRLIYTQQVIPSGEIVWIGTPEKMEINGIKRHAGRLLSDSTPNTFVLYHEAIGLIPFAEIETAKK